MKYVYFLLFFIPAVSLAQTRSEQKMRLMVKEISALPLTVINNSTNEEVQTDVAGYFVMQIQANDELMLKENDFYQLNYQIRASDLSNTLTRIYPQSLTTVLEEVKVEQITTESLGIDAQAALVKVYNPNPNMDFKALFFWLLSKLRKPPVDTGRKPHEMNPYVAGLPRSVMTDYLKIPDSLVEKFYYFMNDDYLIDQYIKSNDEAKWKMHLLDKSFEFLEQEKAIER